jgi:hypothetical protein
MSNFAEGLGRLSSSFYSLKTLNIMDTQQVINLIKDSFESWYNKVFTKASIVINYNDVQTLSIKAYHTISMEVEAISIIEGKAHRKSIISLTENYNHGVTSEDEAKLGLTKKMLKEMFSYQARIL